MSSPTTCCMATYRPPAGYIPVPSGDRRGRVMAHANQGSARSWRISGRHFDFMVRAVFASRRARRRPCGKCLFAPLSQASPTQGEVARRRAVGFLCAGPGQTAVALSADLAGEWPVVPGILYCNVCGCRSSTRHCEHETPAIRQPVVIHSVLRDATGLLENFPIASHCARARGGHSP